MSAAKKNLLWKGILTKKRLPLHLSYKVKCYVHPKGWSSQDLFDQYLDEKAEEEKMRQEMGIEEYNKMRIEKAEQFRKYSYALAEFKRRIAEEETMNKKEKAEEDKKKKMKRKQQGDYDNNKKKKKAASTSGF
jgi:hypothetical protein